nr:toll/interleukin-1 receptor domain-containing protein [Clostridia bacterium]
MLFISYSSKDADMAFQLVDCLEQNNIPCWIAPRDIIPGSTYPSQIVKAIRECNGFVLIASDHVNH